MSIFPQMASIILKEHKFRPIHGDVLLIGRQTVLLTPEKALELMHREGVTPRNGYSLEIDKSTVGSEQAPYITDRSFFSLFSDAKVLALDVSAYEDAEIVHDLNLPLPREYAHIADFIFNGSCLDNLFDPATAIKSISKMLRPNGRVIHLEHGSPVQGAFLCYSPEWFFDFYAVNNYSDCQTLACTFGSSLQNHWKVFRWKPYFEGDAGLQPSPASLALNHFINIVIAEKGPSSTDEQTPLQSHYRSFQKDGTESRYARKFLEFQRSQRLYKFDATAPPIPSIAEPPPGPKGLLIHIFKSCGFGLHKGGMLGYHVRRLRHEEDNGARSSAPATESLDWLGFLLR